MYAASDLAFREKANDEVSRGNGQATEGGPRPGLKLGKKLYRQNQVLQVCGRNKSKICATHYRSVSQSQPLTRWRSNDTHPRWKFDIESHCVYQRASAVEDKIRQKGFHFHKTWTATPKNPVQAKPVLELITNTSLIVVSKMYLSYFGKSVESAVKNKVIRKSLERLSVTMRWLNEHFWRRKSTRKIIYCWEYM